MKYILFLSTLFLVACTNETSSETINGEGFFSSDELIDNLSEYFGESQAVEKTLKVNDNSSTEIKENYSISSDLTRLVKPYDLSGPSNADKFKKSTSTTSGLRVVNYTALDSLHDIRSVVISYRGNKIESFRGERASESFITDDSEILEIEMGESYLLQSRRKSKGKEASTMSLEVSVRK